MWKFYGTIFFTFIILGEGFIIIFDGDVSIDEFSDTELSFTKPLEKHGIEGRIVYADPPDACSEISKPPDTNCSENWIVLIAGNACNYQTKVMHAELVGFSAAVIYNLRGRDNKLNRLPHGYFPNISAVAIKTSYGIIIRENYLYSMNDRYRVSMYPNNFFDFTTFLLLFLLVSGTFIIIVLAFLIVKYVQLAHAARDSRLSSQHLRQLQVTTYQKGDPYETCAICLEDYKNKDKLRILPCLHGYHVKCIDPWLTENKRFCPVCKKKVIVTGQFSGTDVESDVENRAEIAPLLQNYGGSVSFTNYQAMSENAASFQNTQPSSIGETITQNSSTSRVERS
ncbi:e3 ubiquitin-protein ligase RNF167 [Caerostris darwini]|uniref:E3 ubiquitin-protein ligase RNF167 n=1 Tax=Caerostris darwini TaxID=1538125 RepID=A0AAV4Q4T2_9ARAC|nr:e3 ubiquitin-protein ligase RNF167 [Caerostris darwini]